jgi:hypothetical protein
MKCQICHNKTTWDDSYGKSNFIVCPVCFETLVKTIDKNSLEARSIILSILFKIADIKEKVD